MASFKATVEEPVLFSLAGIPAGAIVKNAVATSSDPTIATVTLNADGITGVVTSTGVPGAVQVLIAAQNASDLPITGSGDGEFAAVAPPLATAVDVTFTVAAKAKAK